MRPNQEGRKAPLGRRCLRIGKKRQRSGGLIWSTLRASLLDPWSASDDACDAFSITAPQPPGHGARRDVTTASSYSDRLLIRAGRI